MEEATISKYRWVRRQAGLPTITSRESVRGNVEFRAPQRLMLSSAVSAAKMRQCEGWVDGTVAACEDYARRYLDTDVKIGVRHDWTYRTEIAVAPRSRGGGYTKRYRAYDDCGAFSDEHIFQRGAGISIKMLRLSRARALTNREEYASFNHSPLIGGRLNITREHAYKLVTAHECAHAVLAGGKMLRSTAEQLALDWERMGLYIEASTNYRGPRIDGLKIGAHEAAWQNIYAQFRIHLGLNSAGEIPPPPPPPKPAHCEHCGAEFVKKNPDKRFCSDACRNKAHRAKKRASAK